MSRSTMTTLDKIRAWGALVALLIFVGLAALGLYRYLTPDVIGDTARACRIPDSQIKFDGEMIEVHVNRSLETEPGQAQFSQLGCVINELKVPEPVSQRMLSTNDGDYQGDDYYMVWETNGTDGFVLKVAS